MKSCNENKQLTDCEGIMEEYKTTLMINKAIYSE